MANKYRILADSVTYSTIAMGMISAVALLLSDGDIEWHYWVVRMFSLASIFDFIDGKLARMAGSIERSVDPDTVADYMVFGVVGGLTVYYLIRENALGIPVTIIFTAVCFYRLRRFATKPPSKPGNFDGIPAPFGAYVAAVFIPLHLNEWVVIGAVLFLSVMMATTIPYPAFKRRPTPGDLVWILGMGLIILFLVIFPDSWMKYPAWGLMGFMGYYVFTGWFQTHEYTPRKADPET